MKVIADIPQIDVLEQRISELASRIKELKSRMDKLERPTEVTATDADTVSAVPPKIKRYTREQVIVKAKGDIENLYVGALFWTAEFVVNRNKRIVVCTLKDRYSGEVRSKGVAHCSPDDCFNIHIGKAIALRRALQTDVPKYYTNAPDPTTLKYGDLVRVKGRVYPNYQNKEIVYFDTDTKVIDDSHDFGSEWKFL